jgi:hypothetical protein
VIERAHTIPLDGDAQEYGLFIEVLSMFFEPRDQFLDQLSNALVRLKVLEFDVVSHNPFLSSDSLATSFSKGGRNMSALIYESGKPSAIFSAV